MVGLFQCTLPFGQVCLVQRRLLSVGWLLGLGEGLCNLRSYNSRTDHGSLPRLDLYKSLPILRGSDVPMFGIGFVVSFLAA